MDEQIVGEPQNKKKKMLRVTFAILLIATILLLAAWAVRLVQIARI